jgi:hypothetical protein
LQHDKQTGRAHSDDALHGASSVRVRCQLEITRNSGKIAVISKIATPARYKFDAPATSLAGSGAAASCVSRSLS